jgi:hypothetical protein
VAYARRLKLRSERVKLVFSGFLGFLFPAIANILSKFYTGFPVGVTFFFPFFMVGFAAWILASYNRAFSKTSLLIFYISIPLGVIFDVAMDSAYRQIDRNLFPLEILIWMAISPLPIFVGYIFRRDKGDKGAGGIKN